MACRRLVLTAVAVAIVSLALAAVDALAFRYTVNGTPSVRWQAIADRAPVPTVDIEVQLWLSETGATERCGLDAWGCAEPGQVWIAPGYGARSIAAFRHESGHVYRWAALDDADLSAAARAVGLRPRGVDLDELVADVYMACSASTNPRRAAAYWNRYGQMPYDASADTMRRACRWLRSTAPGRAR